MQDNNIIHFFEIICILFLLFTIDQNDEIKVADQDISKSVINDVSQNNIKSESVKKITLSLESILSQQDIKIPSSQESLTSLHPTSINNILSRSEQFQDKNNMRKIMDIRLFLTNDIQDMSLEDVCRDNNLLKHICLKQRFVQERKNFDAKVYFGGRHLDKNNLNNLFAKEKKVNSIESLFSKVTCSGQKNLNLELQNEIRIEVIEEKRFIDKDFNPYPQMDSVLSIGEQGIYQNHSQNAPDLKRILSAKTKDTVQIQQYRSGMIRPQSHQREKFYQSNNLSNISFKDQLNARQNVNKIDLRNPQNKTTRSKSQIIGLPKYEVYHPIKKSSKKNIQKIEEIDNQKKQNQQLTSKFTQGQSRIIQYIKEQLTDQTNNKEKILKKNDESLDYQANCNQQSQYYSYNSKQNEKDLSFVKADQTTKKSQLSNVKKCLFYAQPSKMQKKSSV